MSIVNDNISLENINNQVLINKEDNAERVLKWANDNLGIIKVASSLQKESSVIIDMVSRIGLDIDIFTINPGNIFDETLDVKKKIEDKYGNKITVLNAIDYAPLDIIVQARADNLWAGRPDECCGVYKVMAFKDAINGVDGFITGLRREHSLGRKNTDFVQWDDNNEMYKISPLADWSEKDVWNYISKYEVPYNLLHDKGYDSIGCTSCTTPGKGREGRWRGMERDECGIHV